MDGADTLVPRQPSDWLWQELQSLRQLMTDQHARLRQDMQISFTDLSNEMRDDRIHDIETRRRVDRILVEREMEERQGVRRTTWIAVLISSSISSAAALGAEIFRWFFRTGPK